MTQYSIEEIEKSLTLPDFDVVAAQLPMVPAPRLRQMVSPSANTRTGSVLLLLYQHNGMWYVVLTRRRDDLNAHAGQISFPGGRHEDSETLMMTALRETEEEIGVAAEDIVVLGELGKIYIPPSDFEVYPFVGVYRKGRPSFRPASDEVAEILEVPLAWLLDPAACQVEEWNFGGQLIPIRFFAVGAHKVWGATAIILNEFLERLRAVKQRSIPGDGPQ
ncbi:MAG: CoA pyrophosphatase [Chloroflexi bacterium]|nr:MAG: CoA pyrophosphatase [Chloroflexota bacterium]